MIELIGTANLADITIIMRELYNYRAAETVYITCIFRLFVAASCNTILFFTVCAL